MENITRDFNGATEKGLDMAEKIINAIMHYVNCTREDAEAMRYGVRKVRNDYYSAFMKDGKLVICEKWFSDS